MAVNTVLMMAIIFGLVIVFLQLYLKELNDGVCGVARRLCVEAVSTMSEK